MGKNVCPPFHPSVRPYVDTFTMERNAAIKPIGDIGKGRLAIHDKMIFKVVRCQGQGPIPKYAKKADFKVYLLRHC